MVMALLPRLVLGSGMGLLVFWWVSSAAMIPGQRFDFVLPVRAGQPTVARLLVDRGAGFVEADSTSAAVPGETTLTEIRLALPGGRIRALRLHPGTVATEYTLGRARIEDRRGRTVASFGTGGFAVLSGARVLDRSATTTKLLATDPNPQLVAVFADPLDLTPAPWTYAVRALLGAGLILLATLAWRRLDRVSPAAAPRLRARVAANGPIVVALAATLAALGAMYPLLVGRSLVSPNVGGTVMLYDQPPYLPGSTDPVLEDGRGSDTGSMMWGIMPYSSVQRESVLAGEWPLWQRYSGLGRPLWGQGQSFFLDPIHLASLLVPDVAAGWDFKFVAARVVFAAGAGMAVLATTGSPAAGAMVAAFAPFIGYFTWRLNHPASFSIVYTPWLLWGFVHLARQRTRRQALAWSAAIGGMTCLQIVSSTPKEGAIALMACYAFGLMAAAGSAGTGTERLTRAGAIVIGGVAGVLLSAPHWLVFLDTLSRAWTVYDTPRAILASPTDLSRLALGALASGTPWPSVHMLIVAGAVLSVVTAPAAPQRAILASCWITIGSCLAIALGAIPTDLILRVPLIGNLYSINTSFAGAAIGPLLLTAGIGFAHCAQAMERRGRAATWLVLMAALALAVLWVQAGSGLLDDLRVQWMAVTLVATVAFPLVLASWRQGRARWSGAAATMLLAGLVLVPGGLHVDTGASRLDAVLMQPRLRPQLTAASPAIAAATRAGPEPFRAIGLGHVLFAGTQALWGLEGIIGADAIEGPWLRQLGTAGGMFDHPFIWLSLFQEADLASKAGLLDMFGVRIVFTHPGQLGGPWRALSLEGADRLQVIERPTAWPRAFFLGTVQIYEQPADLIAALARRTGPFGAIQSTDGRARDLAGRFVGDTGPARQATRYRLTPNTTTFEVEAPGPGVAVVAEAYDEKDFVATVNGAEVPYFRIDHLFKAVAIPAAGTWTVRFEYRPALWRTSWVTAALGLILVAALVVQRRV